MADWPDALRYRPLVAWPREFTRRRVLSPFRAPLRTTLLDLKRELKAVHARDVVLEIAIRENEIRIDGMPYAKARPEHPGVILSMTAEGGALRFPCDAFTDWQDNLRAIVRTMEALRAVERYGVVAQHEQYNAWRAIEGPRAMPQGWPSIEDAAGFIRAMSGERPETSDKDGLVRAVRVAKRRTHPDHGGDPDAFQRVTEAEEYLRTAGAL